VARLNGWQRLWVVITGLWLVVAGGLAGIEIRRPAHAYLDLEGQQHLFLDGPPYPTSSPEVVIVDDAGGHYIFPPGTDTEKAAAVVRHLRNVTRAKVAMVLLVPPLILYVVGWLAGWVYRGFRRT